MPEEQTGAQAQHIYALVARLLLNEIDDELIAVVSTPMVLEILEPVAPGLRQYVQHYDEAAHEAAAEEFTRLFIMPNGVSPRAAAWVEGELETVGAQLSKKAHGYMLNLGREVDVQVAGRLPLDHMGLLLDLAAMSVGTPLEQVVFQDLVQPWAQRYGAALSAKADSPLYVAAGVLLQGLGG